MTLWTSIPWRTCQVLPLPGDEPFVLDVLIRQAVRRDERLTWQEQVVYQCTYQQLYYGFCLARGCYNCDGLL